MNLPPSMKLYMRSRCRRIWRWKKHEKLCFWHRMKTGSSISLASPQWVVLQHNLCYRINLLWFLHRREDENVVCHIIIVTFIRPLVNRQTHASLLRSRMVDFAIMQFFPKRCSHNVCLVLEQLCFACYLLLHKNMPKKTSWCRTDINNTGRTIRESIQSEKILPVYLSCTG